MKFYLPQAELDKLVAMQYSFDQLKKSVEKVKQDIQDMKAKDKSPGTHFESRNES